MHTTRQVLKLLREANPGVTLTEEQVRHALRRGECPLPEKFGGRLAWTFDEIGVLARALRIQVPILRSEA